MTARDAKVDQLEADPVIVQLQAELREARELLFGWYESWALSRAPRDADECDCGGECMGCQTRRYLARTSKPEGER